MAKTYKSQEKKATILSKPWDSIKTTKDGSTVSNQADGYYIAD